MTPTNPQWWIDKLKDIPEDKWIRGTFEGAFPGTGCAMFHVAQSAEMDAAKTFLQQMFLNYLRDNVESINDSGPVASGKRNVLAALMLIDSLKGKAALSHYRWREAIRPFRAAVDELLSGEVPKPVTALALAVEMMKPVKLMIEATGQVLGEGDFAKPSKVLERA